MIQSEGRHHIDEVSLRIEKQSGLTHITAIHTPSNLNIPLKCVSRHSEIQLSKNSDVCQRVYPTF